MWKGQNSGYGNSFKETEERFKKCYGDSVPSHFMVRNYFLNSESSYEKGMVGIFTFETTSKDMVISYYRLNMFSCDTYLNQRGIRFSTEIFESLTEQRLLVNVCKDFKGVFG